MATFQDFPFAAPGGSNALPSIGGTITGVFLDGSAVATVVFATQFASTIAEVGADYMSTSTDGRTITVTVIQSSISLTGFQFIALGGNTGDTGNFTWHATGT